MYQYPDTHLVQQPSTGPAPMYQVHTASFDNNLNQFDWNLLNRTNLESMEATNDTETLENLIYSFVDSKYGAVERQFLPFPLSAKFYATLQMGMDYLLKREKKLQRQMLQQKKEIEYLQHKLAKSCERLDTMPRMTNAEVSVVHSCPVCQRAFKAVLYLDKHIKKAHPEMDDAWNALRNKKPYGLNHAFMELHQDIDHLRSCITRQTHEIDKPVPKVKQDPATFPQKKQIPKKKPILVDQKTKMVTTKMVEPNVNRANFFESDSPNDIDSFSASSTISSISSKGSTMKSSSSGRKSLSDVQSFESEF